MKAEEVIKKVEEHNLFDSTKKKAFLECPRKYFYEYVLGWRPKEASVHLVFGSAWHKALEHINLNQRSSDSIKRAMEIFSAEYRKAFPNPETDDLRKYKIPKNAFRGLLQYVERYASDEFEILATEVGGHIHISPERTMMFKTDLLARDIDGKLFVLDYKTASRYSSVWEMQWQLDIQVGTYTHLGYCSVKEEEEFKGFIIDGFFPHDPPRIKKSGEPYAGSKDNEFHRVKIRKDPEFMLTWLFTVNRIRDHIEEEMNRLWECDTEDKTLKAFPMNPNSCGNYGGCPYHRFCSIWNNPLSRVEGLPPQGFKEEHWNPLNHDIKEAKKVVEI